MSSSWLPGSTHSLARKCSLHLLVASSVSLTRTFSVDCSKWVFEVEKARISKRFCKIESAHTWG
jgi:hypothetical protein